VKPGDRVIYARWPANEFEQDGETFTFLYEEQAILAVLE
jgi:co-chaperonin GroES (HSP10)